MSTLTLNDLLITKKSGLYANAQNTGDVLPIIYGDMTENTGSQGAIVCPCINTVSNHFAIAGHGILSEADGNVLTFYDNEEEIPSTYVTVYHATDYESQGVIAYMDYSGTAQGTITCKCSGKVDEDDNLIINPIAIIKDLVADVETELNLTSVALAEQIADDEGYLAAGGIVSDNTFKFWLNSICSSFLMDWWINNEGKLSLRVDSALSENVGFAGILSERRAQLIRGNQYLSNLKNQILVNYALNFTRQDRRYKESVQSNYLESEDGESTKDIQSQYRYGIRKAEINLDWTRNDATIQTIQERLIEKFKAPLWMIDWIEIGYRNIHVEKGDFVLYSWEERKDIDGNPLQNQYAQVVNKSIDLDGEKIQFLLRDTGDYFTSDYDVYDGSHTAGDGGYFGGGRDTRRLA